MISKRYHFFSSYFSRMHENKQKLLFPERKTLAVWLSYPRPAIWSKSKAYLPGGPGTGTTDNSESDIHLLRSLSFCDSSSRRWASLRVPQSLTVHFLSIKVLRASRALFPAYATPLLLFSLRLKKKLYLFLFYMYCLHVRMCTKYLVSTEAQRGPWRPWDRNHRWQWVWHPSTEIQVRQEQSVLLSMEQSLQPCLSFPQFLHRTRFLEPRNPLQNRDSLGSTQKKGPYSAALVTEDPAMGC